MGSSGCWACWVSPRGSGARAGGLCPAVARLAGRSVSEGYLMSMWPRGVRNDRKHICISDR